MIRAEYNKIRLYGPHMLVSVLLIEDKLNVQLCTSGRTCRNGNAFGTPGSRSVVRIVPLLDFDQFLDCFVLQVA
jgi:hypothetical protein